MSRIGKKAIPVPSGVTVEIKNQTFTVSGPHGKLSRQIPELIKITQEENQLLVLKTEDSRVANALYGLFRTLIQNMVTGVSQRFERKLEIKGVGYRSQMKGKDILLNLGYSHPVVMTPPPNIEVIIESNTVLNIKGIDKEVVGQFAASIRAKRPPEPYKGKGILYQGESIKRKVGKSGK